MNERSRNAPVYGYVPYPAIGYKMGARSMAVTAMTPVTYTGVVGPREAWDPLEGTGTNRKEDTAHRKAIAEYVETVPDYILNAVLVYADANDAKFVPYEDDEAVPIKPGTLYVRPGAKVKVGDGGHRTDAYTDVVNAHEPMQDEVFERLSRSGQPVIVVFDDDRMRRAQDFTDLQRNSKPLNASIGQSMDHRQAINRVLRDTVIRQPDLPIFDNGRRIEFLSDTPGKLSAKVMGYKTLRYASGTLLIGTSIRDTRGWETTVELRIAEDETGAVSQLVEFWRGFGEIPAVEAALKRDKGLALLRNDSWLLGANVIYAIAAAVHSITELGGTSITDAMHSLHSFDFSRGGRSFVGTLVDPETGKAVTGRAAWEGAAALMENHMRKALHLSVA